MFTVEQTWVSHAWLRRVCQRIPEVAPAHAGDPALSTQAPRLLQAAEAFASEADALASVESKVAVAHEECATKAQVLYDRMRVWFPLLTRDVSDFVASAYAGRPAVVEDLISDGQAFTLMVSEQVPSLPYGERLITDVKSALDALKTAYTAEQSLRTERAQREVAEDRAATVLNQELVAFRRMLKRTVGPSHEHYRMLRMPGRDEPDPDDAADAEVAAEPAAPGSGDAGNTPGA